MQIEEESNIAYKDGQGKMIRGGDTCYYQSMKGQWSKGLFHGKKNYVTMNLDIFPKGYLLNYPKAKQL